MSFNRSWRKAIAKTNDDVEKAMRGAALDLFAEIVRRTPVGNPSLWQSPAPRGYIGGRLRGNWQAQVNSPNRDIKDEHDSSGLSTTNEAKRQINKYTVKDRSIYFTNNLPYAERVENGWSSQRPTGMMATTVKQFDELLRRQARKANR